MTEYSDKEKELIEYYKSLPKFSLNIFEMERLLKKPLEYAVDLEYCINNYIFIFGYNLCEIGKGLHENQYLMDEIELSKKHKTQSSLYERITNHEKTDCHSWNGFWWNPSGTGSGRQWPRDRAGGPQ